MGPREPVSTRRASALSLAAGYGTSVPPGDRDVPIASGFTSFTYTGAPDAIEDRAPAEGRRRRRLDEARQQAPPRRGQPAASELKDEAAGEEQEEDDGGGAGPVT